MDTVLIGGLSVLAVMGVVFFTQDRINKSELMPATKRILNVAMILVILGAAAIAIEWHSATWLANR